MSIDIKKNPKSEGKETVGQPGLLVMDMQDSLLSMINNNHELEEAIVFSLKAFDLLKLPICFTEQVPEKLGNTNDTILSASSSFECFSKKSFSAFGCSDFVDWVDRRRIQNLIVCGIETPICIYQTCVDALHRGIAVTLLVDCLGSRRVLDSKVALDQLRAFGCCALPVETLIYSMMDNSEHDSFRDVSSIVRSRDTN
jgi:isochorismate hydrolase